MIIQIRLVIANPGSFGNLDFADSTPLEISDTF